MNKTDDFLQKLSLTSSIHGVFFVFLQTEMAFSASYFPISDPTLIFFVVLLIVLFAPIIMSKLRIPHIIGMVLAGVVIGEYGLHILERDESFGLFGRVGLFYIMFLAGLEMDMESADVGTLYL